MRISGLPNTQEEESLLICIDGGYLRKNIKDMIGNDDIDFLFLTRYLFDTLDEGRIKAELIRAYYYDAIVDSGEFAYQDQEKYFDEIKKEEKLEVKLGRLIKTNKNYRQKGVDILLTIDMLSKAYMNHYDWGILLAGDDDYLDLVYTIKNITGKRVIGAYFEKNVSERLIKSFDKHIKLKKDLLMKNKCIIEK